MENFEKYWGLAATFAGIITIAVTTILTATSDMDNDPSNDPMWQKVLRGIALVISRIFSLSTFRNTSTSRSASIFENERGGLILSTLWSGPSVLRSTPRLRARLMT